MTYHLADRPSVAAAIAAAAAATTLDELDAAITGFKAHDLSQGAAPARSQRPGHERPIMIVTEKPEPEDLETGRPFSGSYGRIARDALHAIGIEADSCAIAYAIHWLTPPDRKQNAEAEDARRAPNKTELATSRPLLFREIELLRPRALIAMGRHVLDSLTGYRGHITPILGSTMAYAHNEQRLQAHVVWHPAWVQRFRNDMPAYIDQLRGAFEACGETRDGTRPGHPIRKSSSVDISREGIFRGLSIGGRIAA